MGFDDKLPKTKGSIDIDNSYCFLQVVNRATTALYFLSATTSSYLNVKMLQQSVACLYNYLLANGGNNINSGDNPNASAIWNDLISTIPTLPTSLGCDNLATLMLTKTNAVMDYIRFTLAYDTANDYLKKLQADMNTPQNGYQNMCVGDYISPILNALIDYNQASTPAEYTLALSEIAGAIITFIEFQKPNIQGNLMDGFTGALYLFLTTPIGKVGMEDSFTLLDAAAAVNGPSYNQLNLSLVELGENNPPNCDYADGTANNVGCGAFMQMLAWCVDSEFSYPSTDCVINANGLACGGTCGNDCTCNTGCAYDSTTTDGTCAGSCLPTSSSCVGPGVCATCPLPTQGTNNWYDSTYGWQSSSAKCSPACPPISSTTSSKKGEK